MCDEISILQKDFRDFRLCPLTKEEHNRMQSMFVINEELLGPCQPERLNPENIRWISVEESIPNYGEKVLASSYGVIYLAYRIEEPEYNEHWKICESNSCSCTGCTGAISHWMKIPNPPFDICDSLNSSNK
jgi:hypothetical protein